MRRGVALGLLVGWLLGIGTGLLGVALTGGWYEHQLVNPETFGATRQQFGLINREGWHIVPGQSNPYYFRRPRLRLP